MPYLSSAEPVLKNATAGVQSTPVLNAGKGFAVLIQGPAGSSTEVSARAGGAFSVPLAVVDTSAGTPQESVQLSVAYDEIFLKVVSGTVVEAYVHR